VVIGPPTVSAVGMVGVVGAGTATTDGLSVRAVGGVILLEPRAWQDGVSLPAEDVLDREWSALQRALEADDEALVLLGVFD